MTVQLPTIIDTDERRRNIVSAVLHIEFGMASVVVPSVDSLIERPLQRPPDFFLLGERPDSEGGKRATALLGSNFPGTPVLFLSAYLAPTLPGADPCVARLIDAEALVAAVQSILASRPRPSE